MASVSTRDMDSKAMSCLPYQIAIAVVSSLLVTSIVLLAVSLRRLRSARYNCTILAQLSERLRGIIAQDQGAIVDLERGISRARVNVDPDLFTIGDDEDDVQIVDDVQVIKPEDRSRLVVSPKVVDISGTSSDESESERQGNNDS